MSIPIRTRREDGGILDGCQLWLVYDEDTNILIGKDLQILNIEEVTE